MFWLRVVLVTLLLHFVTSQVLVQINDGLVKTRRGVGLTEGTDMLDSSDYDEYANEVGHPKTAVDARKLYDASWKDDDLAEDARKLMNSIWNWIRSIDWMGIVKIMCLIAAGILIFFCCWFVCIYVVFVFICTKMRDWCCPANVNAIHISEDEEDCKVNLDVYAHRENILSQV